MKRSSAPHTRHAAELCEKQVSTHWYHILTHLTKEMLGGP